jgi:hypothetical protein
MAAHKLNKTCPICHEPFSKGSSWIVVQNQLESYKWGKKIKYHWFCYNQKDRGIIGEIFL